MSRVAGFLTVGRTPRPDIVNDVQACLDRTVPILECGALDQVPDEEISKYAPIDADDALIASLGNRREAVVSKAKVAAVLQREIKRLEPEVDTFVVLCTGPFPNFESVRKVAQVGSLLFDAVSLLCDEFRFLFTFMLEYICFAYLGVMARP